MALIKNIELPTGINVENAYLRVERVTITKTSMTFSLREYKEQDKPFFNEITFVDVYSIEGENPFKQAYEHLKTLPEFADATDI